ncbi:MAG TPA: ABC transporter ATP-binding protein [Candidatus Saccharimonadales bacterium]|nr:ABC transporter ATP-binding protein [Candidatus Saccharimonadales bacterium]
MVTPIKITNVTKYYGRSKTPAVHKLSLAIEPGEVYGLLGANGAGKTTTLRMILDFIRPTSGTIQLFGTNNRQGARKLRKRIGYLPGDVVLPKGSTGREFLSYLSNLNNNVDHAYMLQLTKRFEAQLDKKMNQLSKGNRQKIGIIQAFMHQPEALVLDEPTSGLDPLMQEQFYKTVDEARERGAAVLLSSHSFEEVERMCDRIGIVRKGRFVYEGSATDIIATQKPRWRVTFKHAGDATKLKSDPALKVIDVGQTSLTVEPADTIEKALAALSHHAIASMTTSQHGLEEEFLRFYEEAASQ